MEGEFGEFKDSDQSLGSVVKIHCGSVVTSCSLTQEGAGSYNLFSQKN